MEMSDLYSKLKLFLGTFWDFVDERLVIRRIFLFATGTLTFQSYYWASSYANNTIATTIDTAAVILAVTAPVTALQGFVFKWYSDSRGS